MDFDLPPQNKTAFRQSILGIDDPKKYSKEPLTIVNEHVQNLLKQPANLELRLVKPTPQEQQLAERIKTINPNTMAGGPIFSEYGEIQYIILNDNAIKNDKTLSEEQKKLYMQTGNFHNSNNGQIVINVSAAFDKKSEQPELNAAFKDPMDAIKFTLDHERAHAQDFLLNKDRLSKYSVLNDSEQNNNKKLSENDAIFANNMRTLSKETYADGAAAIIYLQTDNGMKIEDKYKELHQYGQVKEKTWNESGNSLTKINHLTTHSIDKIIDDHKKGLIPTDPNKQNEYLNNLREEQLDYAIAKYENISPSNKKETESYLSNSYRSFWGYSKNESDGKIKAEELAQTLKSTNQRHLSIEESVQQKMDNLCHKSETNNFLPSGSFTHQEYQSITPKFQS